ncbi:MAG TPA: hypothetical protein VMW32_09430 [Bacteroidales bacterium]|nr:hypothetical protein [Bacteroidales bacterium]
MGLRSTPLISYHDIKTDEIDLYADAWGIYPEFDDVISLLNQLKPVPEKRLTKRLIKRVRQQN